MYPNSFYESYEIPYNTSNIYTNVYPNMNTISSIGKVGLFSKIKNGFNWNSFLNNTSRTLNIINQAIPVVNQVRPLVSNMKTMFKIANIMKEDNYTKNNIVSNEKSVKNNKVDYQNDNQPTFFL